MVQTSIRISQNRIISNAIQLLIQMSLAHSTKFYAKNSKHETDEEYDYKSHIRYIITHSRYFILVLVINILNANKSQTDDLHMQLIYIDQQMENTSLEEKQQYLRTHIMEAGHDPEKFIQFCSSRHNLEDLENWTMIELVNIVQSYKNQQLVNHKEIQTHSEQFTQFQMPKQIVTSIQPQNALKNDLIFSQDDWNMFLGSTKIPIPGEASNNINFQTPINNSKSDINIPLSPPSINPIILNNSQIKAPMNFDQKSKEDAVQEKEINKNVKQLKKQQKQLIESLKSQKKSTNDSNPLNLCNVRLVTGKQKNLPNLPIINDVIVIKTEQISRNFLQPDYTLYYISFIPTQIVIERRFNDLRKLRSILSKMFPFIRFPYLEPEGWLTSSEGKDPEILTKYKWMVEEFMRFILLRSNELRDNPLVRNFCGFSNKNQKKQISRDQLKKVLELHDSLPRPKNISDVVLNQNKIIIPPINNSEKLVSSTTVLISDLDILYEKLKKQMDLLFYNYELVAKSLNEVTNTFESFELLFKRYHNQNDEKQMRIFQGFKEMSVKMSQKLSDQHLIFKHKIRNLFRYERDNMTTLKELFQPRNRIHSQFIRQGMPNLSNVSKQEGAIIQIESAIPLEQPNKNKNTLVLQEIFWSYQTSQEIKRYIQHLRKRINENLTQISYDQLDNENDNLNFWNCMIKKCLIDR